MPTAQGTFNFTVTIRDVNGATASQKFSITIAPSVPLAITTTSLPSGNVGTMYSATILSNSQGSGQTWSVSAGLPPGLALPGPAGNGCAGGCLISGMPTAQGTFSFTVTIRDVNGATASQKLSITIGPPLPLSASLVTPLPDGIVNSGYQTPLPAFVAVAGGVPPFTWSLASGSSLPSNLALDASGNISGTPTTFGNFNFTVMVSDSETPAMTATAGLSLTIRNVLFGQYSFLFHGSDANGAVVAAGSFTSDGMDNITGGVEDINRHSPGPATNVAFTGSYAMGQDNRGTLTFTSSLGTSTYAFATDGGNGRFIESDSSGTHGSGEMRPGIGACPPLATSGTGIHAYVFGVSGDDLNKGRVAVAGSFQADGAGNLSSGLLDQNDAGTVASNVAWTGTYTTPAGASRCTMTLTMAGSPTRNFAYYAFGGIGFIGLPAYLVELDAVASGVPVAGGTVLSVFPDSNAPAGSLFTNASFHTPIVGGLTGFSASSGAPDVSLAFFSPDGNGNVNMTVDENNGGAVTLGTALAGTYDVSASGRVTLTAGKNPPVLYLVNTTEAFVVGTDNAASSGRLERQANEPGGSTTLSNATIAGNFISGTDAPAGMSVSDLSGIAAFDGVSALTATLDESTLTTNTSGQAFTGTYSVTSTPVDGHGTFTLSPTGGPPANFVFLTLATESCVKRRFNGRFSSCVQWSAPFAFKVVAIPSDTAQTNPAVLVLEK